MKKGTIIILVIICGLFLGGCGNPKATKAFRSEPGVAVPGFHSTSTDTKI